MAEQQTQQELQQRQRQPQAQQQNPQEWTPQWRRTPSVESPQPRSQQQGSPFGQQEIIDPRYRGSAIPSNSFKYLQDMVGLTDKEGEIKSLFFSFLFNFIILSTL